MRLHDVIIRAHILGLMVGLVPQCIANIHIGMIKEVMRGLLFHTPNVTMDFHLCVHCIKKMGSPHLSRPRHQYKNHM